MHSFIVLTAKCNKNKFLYLQFIQDAQFSLFFSQKGENDFVLIYDNQSANYSPGSLDSTRCYIQRVESIADKERG